jgi:sugar O-acyltransferase (sialic acid O-acetyltransferase NeuD family)
MNRRVVIVGAGGQGRIVADILLACSANSSSAPVPIGFVNDSPQNQNQAFLGLPVLGTIEALATIDHDAMIVAIGDNAARRDITARLLSAGERLETAIHPSAQVGHEVRLGDGSMLSAGSIITPRVTIGAGVIVNTKASVDHDSEVGDFAHISPGATVGAHCAVGSGTMIGMGATVMSTCAVGSGTTVGAGSVVVRDLPGNVVAYGVPARVRRSLT